MAEGFVKDFVLIRAPMAGEGPEVTAVLERKEEARRLEKALAADEEAMSWGSK